MVISISPSISLGGFRTRAGSRAEWAWCTRCGSGRAAEARGPGRRRSIRCSCGSARAARRGSRRRRSRSMAASISSATWAGVPMNSIPKEDAATASSRSVLRSGGAVAAHEVLQGSAFAVGGQARWQRLVERELLEVDLGVRRDADQRLLDEPIGRAEAGLCAARASASVAATVGETTNSTLMSSGLRPAALARARMSLRYSFIPSMPVPTAMIASAAPAANCRPFGEAPAWRKVGRCCGEGTVFSGPRDLKYFPSKVDGVDLVVVGVGVGLAVHHDGVGLPGVPQLVDDVEVLLGHVVALVVLGQAVEPEVLCGPVLGGGHDVPAEPALRDRVDRRARAAPADTAGRSSSTSSRPPRDSWC